MFHARRLKEFVETYGGGLWFLWTLTLLRWRIQRDPASRQYTDIAITPAEGDDDGLEMYQATDTKDERALRHSTMPQRTGMRRRHPSPPGLPTVTATTVTMPKTPRHSIAPATPAVGSVHFAMASPSVQMM